MLRNRNMEAENWSTEQLASCLGVSVSWVSKRIREGLIVAEMVGPSKWPKLKFYSITKEEVKRVLIELPLPATGETLAHRLERGCNRLYRELGLHCEAEVQRFLNLEQHEDDRIFLTSMLLYTSRKPRPRFRWPKRDGA